MFLNLVSFIAGIALLQTQQALPYTHLYWLLPVLLFLLVRYQAFRIPLAFLIGFLWAGLYAWLNLQNYLPEELYKRDVFITGTVSELPHRHSRHVSFEFSIDEINYQGGSYPSPGTAKLNWYNDQVQIHAGDRWQLKVRLKPPHGLMNPAGFDYEGWLFQRGIRAKGYVRDDSGNQNLGEGGYRFAVLKLRQQIRSLIDLQLQHGKAVALVKALVIGDRSGMSRSDWNLFRSTGTSHLVAISGLHISIVGGLAYYLVNLCWRRFSWLTLRFAAPKAAALGALLAGAGYAALAGFSVPTQRALVMLTVVSVGSALQTGFSPFRSLGVALLIVLLIDPMAILSGGFWLSFIAVTVIFTAISNRSGAATPLFSWFGIQWCVALGLAPALLVWQQQLPLLTPLTNMLAIPLFSLLIIPLTLGGTLLSLIWPEAGYLPMIAADWLLDTNRTVLARAAGTDLFFSAPTDLPVILWGAVAIGTLLVLLPRGIPGRLPALVMLLPLFLQPVRSTLPQQSFRFTLLDVGQGLAAVVQTRNHTLVYDTGPVFSQEFNAGSDLLFPFLRRQGVGFIDLLVVSNGDSDHRGGLSGLVEEMDVGQVLSGEPHRITELAVGACSSALSWNWDGVKFSFLHPGQDENWSGNNASCVLKVENVTGKLLITGDIESAAEQKLLSCCREELEASVLTMPHHGSNTSSTEAFVQAVDADFVLASTGYLNRYGFPKPQIVARWEEQGGEVLDTALTGAVEFLFNHQTGIAGPDRYRISASRYWTHLPQSNHTSN